MALFGYHPPASINIPYEYHFMSWLPTSHSAPCLWPRKVVEDVPNPRDPVPAWENWKELLASDWLRSGHCSNLESEPGDGRSFTLSPLL